MTEVKIIGGMTDAESAAFTKAQIEKKEAAYIREIEQLQAQRDKLLIEVKHLRETVQEWQRRGTSDASDSDFGSGRRRYVTFK